MRCAAWDNDPSPVAPCQSHPETQIEEDRGCSPSKHVRIGGRDIVMPVDLSDRIGLCLAEAGRCVVNRRILYVTESPPPAGPRSHARAADGQRTTGTPRGICTIDGDDDGLTQHLAFHGTPRTGSIEIAASMSRQVSRPTTPAISGCKAPALGLPSIAKQLGRASDERKPLLFHGDGPVRSRRRTASRMRFPV